MKTLQIFKLLLTVNACFAIRCYECGQANQYRCANVIELQKNICPEPINDTAEAHAAGVKNVCIKTTIQDKNPNNTELYVNRQCGRLGPGREDSCNYFKSQSRNMSCYSCDTELCNKSEGQFKVSTFVLTLMVTFAVSLIVI